MIDHLLLFTDEATAHATLDPLGFGRPSFKEDKITFPASWDGSRVLPCRVIIGHTPVTYKDENGNDVTFDKDVYMDGFHINIAAPTVLESLSELEECVLITDREKAIEDAEREDFIILTRVSEETMNAVLGVTPMFAGSLYPFGKPKTTKE